MKKVLLIVITVLLSSTNMLAQCAMCRSTVETNVAAGDVSLGAGLNFGIMYLFVTPYLMFMIIAFFWYRNARMNKKLRLVDLVKRKNLKI